METQVDLFQATKALCGKEHLPDPLESLCEPLKCYPLPKLSGEAKLYVHIGALETFQNTAIRGLLALPTHVVDPVYRSAPLICGPPSSLWSRDVFRLVGEFLSLKGLLATRCCCRDARNAVNAFLKTALNVQLAFLNVKEVYETKKLQERAPTVRTFLLVRSIVKGMSRATSALATLEQLVDTEKRLVASANSQIDLLNDTYQQALEKVEQVAAIGSLRDTASEYASLQDTVEQMTRKLIEILGLSREMEELARHLNLTFNHVGIAGPPSPPFSGRRPCRHGGRPDTEEPHFMERLKEPALLIQRRSDAPSRSSFPKPSHAEWLCALEESSGQLHRCALTAEQQRPALHANIAQLEFLGSTTLPRLSRRLLMLQARCEIALQIYKECIETPLNLVKGNLNRVREKLSEAHSAFSYYHKRAETVISKGLVDHRPDLIAKSKSLKERSKGLADEQQWLLPDIRREASTDSHCASSTDARKPFARLALLQEPALTFDVSLALQCAPFSSEMEVTHHLDPAKEARPRRAMMLD